MASAAAVIKGVTKFARNPTLENGLSIVGEVATNLAINFIMNKLGGAVVKRLGTWAQKSMNKLGLSERASNIANRLLCTVTGHPVDVISGYLYTETVDFEFPGPIPLRWERLWNSTSVHAGSLGHGWHHSYELALVVEELEGYAALRGADGRGIAFEVPALGERAFNRLEKMSLLRDERGYGVLDHGQSLTYRFGPARPDGVRLLAAVENANNFAIAFTYDAHGHLAQVVDSAKRQFAVQCDEAGRILTVSTAHPTEPRQRVTLVTYTYNGRAELISAADALAQVATYQYQDKLLVRETFKNGLSFYFEYAGQGPEARCIRTWGDEGIYDHKLVYDVEARRTVVTNSLGYATTYLGNENGLVVEVQDARGGVALIEYNEYNEFLSETDPLGFTTRHTYDERGNCLHTVQPDGAEVRNEYDAHGHLIALTDAVGGCWKWTYDEAGNLLTQTNPVGNTDCYAYTKGLLKRLTDAGRQVTELVYDEMYNVREQRAAQGTTHWLYDGWGRSRKRTDSRSNVQWRSYDLLGRIVTLHEPDGNVRRFTYDGLGNVVRVQDRLHDVYYSYRGLGRLIRRAEAGTAIEFLHDTEEQLRAVVNEHGLTYRFGLDAAGDVITEVGFDGLTRHYQRDIAGRVTEVELPIGQRTRYAYDPVGRTTSVHYDDGQREVYTYRADGALLSATNDTVVVSYRRDILGNILQETQGPYTLTYTYDMLGQQVGLTSSLGADVRYTRDESGQLTQVKAGTTWQALFERDKQGLELHRTLSGGVRTRWKRDTLGRPAEQHISTGLSGPKRTRTYEWQIDDRLTHLEDSQYGMTRFTHDALGNLATTTFGDGGRELRLPDAVGNLFKTADRSDRQYGLAGQLIEAQGSHYQYDALGNLVHQYTSAGQQWHYTWTSAGYLAEVVRPDGKVVRFAYDALGRRIRKSYQGRATCWVWNGNVPLHEWQQPDASEEVEQVVTWLFEDDSFAPIAKLTCHENYSIVTDHLGTPLALYNEQGTQKWETQFNSYEAVRQPRVETVDCPFRYQGQYEDVETGLYYNRFRYYNPQTGQYISQDPIRLRGGLSVYNYVPDTLVGIDALGLSGYVLGKNLLKAGQTHSINPFNRTADWQAHHLIPEEVWGQNKQFFKDIGVRGRDSARNGIFLPNSDALGNQHSFERYHLGSHSKYSANVSRQLASIETDYRGGMLSKQQAKQEVELLQHSLRNKLSTRTTGTGCKRLS
jgi:RHS repeat-associated protein